MSGTRITIEKMISAPSQKVWAELSDIESHVEWMADAVALEFHSEQRSGIGTSFACRTKIGPFYTTDEMVIDQWREGTAVGVTHSGAVTGSGTFELKEISTSETLVTWSEVLVFPWWMAGKIGSTVARPIFGWIWKRNLSRLSDRVLQHI